MSGQARPPRRRALPAKPTAHDIAKRDKPGCDRWSPDDRARAGGTHGGNGWLSRPGIFSRPLAGLLLQTLGANGSKVDARSVGSCGDNSRTDRSPGFMFIGRAPDLEAILDDQATSTHRESPASTPRPAPRYARRLPANGEHAPRNAAGFRLKALRLKRSLHRSAILNTKHRFSA